MATYVNRLFPFDVVYNIFPPADASFPSVDWSEDPSGLAALVTGNVPKRYWIYDPPGGDALREQTAPEKLSTDTNPANVAVAQAVQKEEVLMETKEYMATRYDPYTQTVFFGTAIKATGQQNVALNNWSDWFITVYEADTAVQNAIDAASNVATILAMGVDYAPFTLSDPELTIQILYNL